MKKKLIILILLATSINNAFAQASSESDNVNNDTQLGIKAGINRSNVYDEQGDQFVADPTYGFVLGGFITLPVLPLLGVQGEFLFSQKGFEGHGGSGVLAYSFKRTSNFLDIPIMAQLKLDPRLSLLAGVQYSYLLSQENDFESDITSVSRKEEFSNENYRKNIFGFIIGADINFSNTILSARAAWDVQDNNGDGSSSLPRYKNTLIQLTLGFKF